MAWLETKAHLLTKVEAARPDSSPRTGFKRTAGRATVANTARTSGGVRKCDLLAESARTGPQINGTSPKQVIQSASLRVLYPKTGKANQLDEIHSDVSLIRSVLEDPRSYDFGSTGWQNCKVLGDSVSEAEGGYIATLTLELIYIGAH